MNDTLYQLGYKTLSNHLKYIFTGIIFLLLTISCGTTKYIVAENESKEVINYVDSVRYEIRDSVILIPREYYKDYTSLLDTLVISSPRSEAKAWVDTTYHILSGSLENSPEMPFKREIIYKDRIVERTDTVFIQKQVPYPVEVVTKVYPKAFWWLLGYTILSVICLALWIYLKIKRVF